MNELKKNNLIKARKLSYIFRFIIDLNAINVGGEFERNNCDIYPKELELDKENTDTNEASFMDSDIKIEDGMFQVGLFNKRKEPLSRDSFPFPTVRMPDKLCTI